MESRKIKSKKQQAVQGFNKAYQKLEAEMLQLVIEVNHHAQTQPKDKRLPGTLTIRKVTLIGSRLKGTARPDSDLDVLLEYEGSMSEEDAFFRFLFHKKPGDMEVNKIRIDVTPVKRGHRWPAYLN